LLKWKKLIAQKNDFEKTRSNVTCQLPKDSFYVPPNLYRFGGFLISTTNLFEDNIMKTGLTLVQLAEELTAQQESKRDFHAPTSSLSMLGNGDFHLETNNGSEIMPATDFAHAQMASRLQVAKPYYDRMRREAPALLSTNVNHWLGKKQGETSLIRTLRGQMRAFLSNRYRIVDNHDILAIAIPELADNSDLKIVSCNVTDHKMYIKVVNTSLEAAISVGDIVQAGFVLSNGELGNGSIAIEPFLYRLVCTNGMSVPDRKIRKNHAGRGVENQDLYANDTLQAIDDAFKLKIRDLIRNAISIGTFNEIVADMRDSKADPIVGHPAKAVELTAKAIGLNDDESSKVLNHLIRAGDLSRFGLFNAVTRMAEDTESYDRATEIERLGSSVLYLPQSTWREVSTARN
jgi:hypothetical protein